MTTKGEAGRESQVLERVRNLGYNTFTTKPEQRRRAFSTVRREPEMERYFPPLTGGFKRDVRNGGNTKITSSDSKSKVKKKRTAEYLRWIPNLLKSLLPGHMNNELKAFSSAYSSTKMGHHMWPEGSGLERNLLTYVTTFLDCEPGSERDHFSWALSTWIFKFRFLLRLLATRPESIPGGKGNPKRSGPQTCPRFARTQPRPFIFLKDVCSVHFPSFPREGSIYVTVATS